MQRSSQPALRATGAQVSFSIASRSSALNSGVLPGCVPIARTSRSASRAACATISRCPFVTGSKEPGKRAVRGMQAVYPAESGTARALPAFTGHQRPRAPRRRGRALSPWMSTHASLRRGRTVLERHAVRGCRRALGRGRWSPPALGVSVHGDHAVRQAFAIEARSNAATTPVAWHDACQGQTWPYLSDACLRRGHAAPDQPAAQTPVQTQQVRVLNYEPANGGRGRRRHALGAQGTPRYPARRRRPRSEASNGRHPTISTIPAP